MLLENAITTIIDSDQTGFIPKRQSYFNMWRLFNILYADHSNLKPETIISFDAEKAFHRVEWDHLFTVLNKFGFGPIFCNWIKILYATPTGSVLTISPQDAFHCEEGQGKAVVCLLFYLIWPSNP